MRIRIARHTTALAEIVAFYCDLLGLQMIGSFAAHQGYSGVFIGPADADWHLEFTVSAGAPEHAADADDLLLFYIPKKTKYDRIIAALKAADAKETAPRNPYWQQRGRTFLDPDGFSVVLCNREWPAAAGEAGGSS